MVSRTVLTSVATSKGFGRNFDPGLAIYDGRRRLLATKNASRYGEGERVSARVRAAGRYFLRVANHAGAESPESYSVAVRMHTH